MIDELGNGNAPVAQLGQRPHSIHGQGPGPVPVVVRSAGGNSPRPEDDGQDCHCHRGKQTAERSRAGLRPVYERRHREISLRRQIEYVRKAAFVITTLGMLVSIFAIVMLLKPPGQRTASGQVRAYRKRIALPQAAQRNFAGRRARLRARPDDALLEPCLGADLRLPGERGNRRKLTELIIPLEMADAVGNAVGVLA